jgi:hypothetical protein
MYAERNDPALDPYLAELRVLRIRRTAMATRNRVDFLYPRGEFL